MEPIVRVQNLNKTIKGKHIIKDLNLDFYPGQITGFLGPNGAGKTTTIRMITGLMYPTSGDVIIDGVSLAKDYEGAMKNVGVIVENPEMYKYMSGYKNLKHFARMHDNVSKERIDEVVAQVGLEKRIHEKVGTYSLGMRQRLGLAQAMLHSPKFLILDEPTNGLDPAGIREYRSYLRKIAHEENISIVVSSHLLAEMELICDRIAVIKNGEIIDIREMNDRETSTVYVLEASPSEAVSAALSELEIVYTKENDAYQLEIEREQVPAIVARVARDGQLFAIYPHQQTLEDQFIELTGSGGAIDEIRS
ncbi:MAG: ABC transporter ATP-binding protein [Lysinibacillus sp.]